MAKDEIDPEDLVEGVEIEEEEIDLDDLEDEILDDELEDDLDDELEDDAEGAETDDGDESVGTTVVRRGTEDEDDEDDLVAPDDVEEDLAEILQDRLANEDEPAEEEEPAEWDDRSGTEDALQPKRADEILCSSCFLLVRKGAPACPVGDDSCPVFTK